MRFMGVTCLICASCTILGCENSASDKARSPNTGASQNTVQTVTKVSGGGGEAEDGAEITASLAKLSPEDRKLAEAQKYCVVESENRLGAMGAPIKLMVKDQAVFVCCKGCSKEALADPEKTLAKVAELKAKATAESKK